MKALLVDASKSLHDKGAHHTILQAIAQAAAKTPPPGQAYIFPPAKPEPVCTSPTRECWNLLYEKLHKILSRGGRPTSPLGEAIHNLASQLPPGSTIITITDGDWNTIRPGPRHERLLQQLQQALEARGQQVIILLVGAPDPDYTTARLLSLPRITAEPMLDHEDLAETLHNLLAQTS